MPCCCRRRVPAANSWPPRRRQWGHRLPRRRGRCGLLGVAASPHVGPRRHSSVSKFLPTGGVARSEEEIHEADNSNERPDIAEFCSTCSERLSSALWPCSPTSNSTTRNPPPAHLPRSGISKFGEKCVKKTHLGGENGEKLTEIIVYAYIIGIWSASPPPASRRFSAGPPGASCLPPPAERRKTQAGRRFSPGPPGAWATMDMQNLVPFVNLFSFEDLKVS